MSHLKQTDIVIDFWIPTTHCQYLPHSTESLSTVEHFNCSFELWLSWKLLSTNHIPTLSTLLLHLYLLRSVMCYFQQSHTTWSHNFPTHKLITQQCSIEKTPGWTIGHIIPCGPESADGHRSVRPHRHNTDPPLFLLLYVQITNRKPRKETPGNLRIEYWGQFGGYALWRRTTNKPHWAIFLKTSRS